MVEWAVCAEVEVMADSIESAIEEVELNDSLVPADGSYIDGSLTINREFTYQNNKKYFS